VTADFKQGTNLLGKILASGQVASANADTTVYTVPASTAVKIASGLLCNTGSSSATVSVSVVPSGGTVDGTHKVVDSYPLAAHDSTVITEIVGAMLDAGASISVRSSQATSVDYLFTGAESS
jgi:hypothetical protein